MSNDILKDLRGESNFAFGQLYQDYFDMVNRFVINNSGRTQDAEDIFQDTMFVLLQKLRQDNFELTASLRTYVMAISKNLWLKRLRTGNRELRLNDGHENLFFDEISLAIENEKTYWDKLQGYLQKITDHCNRLIQDIFFRHKAIEQIQEEYGYSSVHNAQNQKHKCVQQIRKVKEKEERKEKTS